MGPSSKPVISIKTNTIINIGHPFGNYEWINIHKIKGTRTNYIISLLKVGSKYNEK